MLTYVPVSALVISRIPALHISLSHIYIYIYIYIYRSETPLVTGLSLISKPETGPYKLAGSYIRPHSFKLNFNILLIGISLKFKREQEGHVKYFAHVEKQNVSIIYKLVILNFNRAPFRVDM